MGKVEILNRAAVATIAVGHVVPLDPFIPDRRPWKASTGNDGSYICLTSIPKISDCFLIDAMISYLTSLLKRYRRAKNIYMVWGS
jgi:hypothetical protein